MDDPYLSTERVAEIVVDRRYGFAAPVTIAVGELLISLHPDSVAEARRVDARLATFDEHCEDPVAKFERLTGRSLGVNPRGADVSEKAPGRSARGIRTAFGSS